MRQPGRILRERGFTLVETLVASGVLTVGMLGVAAVFARGLQRVGNSPLDLIATQKATEAVESVYTARDNHSHKWGEIRNVSNGGLFLDGFQPLREAGPDGLMNTADDGPIERLVSAGPDNILNTPDDEVLELDMFTRKVEITDLSPTLRQLRVIVHYQNGPEVREFVLVTYISSYA